VTGVRRAQKRTRLRLAGSQPGVTLDAGALLEVERGAPWLTALLAEIRALGGEIAIPAGVLAQAWRGPRSARMSHLARANETVVVPLDDLTARAIGQLLAASGTSDVIDASVVLTARLLGHPIVTSDGEDLRRLDPSARLFRADSGQPV
jgi:hypothetical protein